MAEVGLVRFAVVCRTVAETGLPAYRSKVSKHLFTQPQLLTILCLMRYEDWTFRDAAGRLREHRALRQALQRPAGPDDTTGYRFLRRRDADTIQRVLTAVGHRLPLRRRKTLRGVDGTGLPPGAVSTCFVKRRKDQGGTWRRWCNWLIAGDIPRRAMLAQQARQGPTNDCATWRPVVATASTVVPGGAGVADAGFDSERNHRLIRETLHARRAMPAIRGPRGRPRRRPRRIIGDKGYDSDPLRQTLRQLGIRPDFPRRRSPDRLGRERWVVERTISWLNRFRRLRIRYERLPSLHLAFLQLGCTLICWHALTRWF